MVYFFERDRDRARTVVETRRDEGRFEIALHHPDGTTTVHAAETAQHFLARLEEVSAWLREARWRHRPIDPLLTSVARLDSTDLMR